MTAPSSAAAAAAAASSSNNTPPAGGAGVKKESSSSATTKQQQQQQQQQPQLPVFELKGRFERAPVQELVGHRKRVQCLAFNASGSQLASGSADGSIRVWPTSSGGNSGGGLVLLSSGSSAELPRGHEKDVCKLAWNPHSEHQLASCSRGKGEKERGVRLWDTRGKGSEAGRISAVQGSAGGGGGGGRGERVGGGHEFDHLAWSPDGRYLAAVMDYQHLVAFDVRKGQALGRPKNMRADIASLMWAPSSQALFLGLQFQNTTTPGVVEVYSLHKHERLHSFEPHTGSVLSMAIDASDTHMAMGSEDGLVSIWDFQSLTCLRSMDRLNHDVTALAFSYDGRLLAVGADEKASVDITEVATGLQVCALPNGAERPSLAWHPKALLLAFAAEGGGGDVGGSSIGMPGAGGGGFGSLVGGGGGRGQGPPKEENVRFVSVIDR